MDINEFIKSLELSYQIKLPKRYCDFLLNKEFEKYKTPVMFKGYIQGPYFLNFTDPLLNNPIELGMNQGISDIEDSWSDDLKHYIPLASFSHPKVLEPKGFFVWDSSADKMPVLLFDYEGPKLFAIANSFDEFLKNLPDIINDSGRSAYAWDICEKKFEFWKN